MLLQYLEYSILSLTPTAVEKAIEFVQAEKLFYETALIQAGREELNGTKTIRC